MPITSSDIKRIINTYMPRGQWVHVGDIKDLIQRHYPLTAVDCEPHTNSRPTTYPVWKNKVQGVLSGMKSDGIIQHDKNTNSYMI